MQVFRVGRSSGGMLPEFKSPLHYQLGGPESILSLLCETSIEGNSVGLLSSTSEDSCNMLRREPISHHCHLSHSHPGSPAGAVRVTLTLQLTVYIPLWKPTRGINYFSGFLQDFSCLESGDEVFCCLHIPSPDDAILETRSTVGSFLSICCASTRLSTWKMHIKHLVIICEIFKALMFKYIQDNNLISNVYYSYILFKN